ncbi:PDR/VanB family oxidoreductase [Gluconacetobacter tumulisoli]|uniref:Oxidoreductase n=1 Tax=Gluconacetobacter tumulisoli TaxID=1286189 RepID=A0A7W4K6P4_9PROT|nr:PDR/VanB family oxidoreductase [Gluconacetobacter tumulisoli]MBB2201389.1 oxidoreductase [Gluconacetobacter tumulisoli]
MSIAMFPTIACEIAPEGTDCLRLTLVAPDGKPLPAFSPGAHIDVLTPAGLTRQYSLCGSPHDTAWYEICVKRESTSRGGSRSLHEGVKPGAVLMISAPRNAFPLPEASRHILIAGGIGITPLIPMVRDLSARGRSFAFHYYASRPAEAPFLTEFRAGAFGPGASLRASFADHPPAGLESADPADAIMLCGPTGFMAAVRTRALFHGWRAEQIHCEHFQPPVDLPAHQGGDEAFAVRLARSGRVLEVGADESIAEALLAQGVSVDLSCEQGMCGACLMPLLDGEADHRDSVQGDGEKARNVQIALCCSRAKSACLVLDL